MSKLEALTGKNYLSFSSLQSYLDCSERFRLERVLNAPQEGSWWLIGGKAFHAATEAMDREGGTPDLDTLWRWAMTAELQGVDESTLRAGGRESKQWPNKENKDWWMHHGPKMLADYVAWRTDRFSDGWQFFATPDGNPAIELEIQVEFADILVKGYIDRVMVTGDGEVIVVDLKTGSHAPASTLQLGIYALGVQRHLAVTPTIGSYYMARKAELTPPRSLVHYTHDLVGQWFGKAKAAIEAELFIPHVTSMCGTCSVAPYCVAMGGTAVVPGHRRA